MILNKVVARFKDGRIIKGKSNDFSPNKSYFHLEIAARKVIDVKIGELKVVEINIKDLKAAFFVKDFKGNKYRRDEYRDIITGGGKKVKVKFLDGEEIIGYTQSYSPERQGFFVVPADIRSNNERIFVIRSATEKVWFMSA